MKIALIGSAPSSVRQAPFGSSDWQIWGCSPGAWAVVPRSDRWFEIHRWEPGQPWMSEDYCDFVKNHPDAWVSVEVPGTYMKPLPVEELVAKYGPYFFTSTLSWMFAMAIEEILAWREKGNEGGSIGLWGVDMAATEEYGYQRAGCQYFAMIAKSLGIEVGVPPESDLLRPAPLYGVCETTHHWIKATQRERELQHRLQQAEWDARAKQEEATFLKGAIDDLNWNKNTWMGNVDALGQQYVEPPEVPVLTDIRSPKAGFDEDGNITAFRSLEVGSTDILGIQEGVGK